MPSLSAATRQLTATRHPVANRHPATGTLSPTGNLAFPVRTIKEICRASP